MATTHIGNAADTPPVEVHEVRIDVKQDWSDEWVNRADLRLEHLSMTTAGHDLDRLTFIRPYGRVKHPHEADFSTDTPLDLAFWWVRVRIYTGAAYETLWVGRLAGVRERFHGVDPQRGGIQTYTAYGPLQILRKTWVSSSIWLEGEVEKDIGWAPDFNARDRQGLRTGNRSADQSGGTYCFGGETLWTGTQAITYLLERFVEQGEYEPAWAVSGATAVLDGITDTVRVGVTASVADLLREWINPRYGIDYTIKPTEGGFEIVVFALTKSEQTFSTATLPANADTVEVHVGTSYRVAGVEVAASDEHNYSTIRVLGNRIVVAFTLKGSETTLVDGWTAALETAYEAGTGVPADPAGEHDQARDVDRFRPVFQLLVAAANVGVEAPTLDDEGYLADPQPDPGPDHQKVVRETLPALPLYEGFDYTADPADDENPAGLLPDPLPPIAILYDTATSRYVLADAAQVGVCAFRQDYGVLLLAKPNHRLGLNHFVGTTETEPEFDWDQAVVTLAGPTDHRLMLTYATGSGDGSTLDIEAPDGELWCMVADTVVGVAADGTLATGGASARVLRNDNERLHYVMAGAKARYAASRNRAVITYLDYLAAGNLLGQILSKVHQDGTETAIDAPITAMEWIGEGGPRTIIHAGFAL